VGSLHVRHQKDPETKEFQMGSAISDTPTTMDAPREAALVPGFLLPSVAQLSLARVARGLFRLFLLLIAARLLGPEQFGVYAFLLAVSEILSFVSGGGFTDYLTREVAKHPGLAFQYGRGLTQLRFFYLAALIAITWPVLRLLGYSFPIAASVSLFSLSLFPRAVAESSKGLLRAAHRYTWFLLLELLEGMVLVSVGVFLLSRGSGLRGLIWAEIVSGLVAAAVSLRMVLGLFIRERSTPFPWHQVVRKTVAFNVYPIVVNIYDRVDVVLLSKLAGNVAAGLYMIPYRILPMLQVLPYGLMGVLLPILSVPGDRKKEKDYCTDVMGILYPAALFFILETMLLADLGTRVALGNQYQGCALILKVLIWATVPMFLNNALNIFLLARNEEKLLVRTAFVCMLVNIGVNLFVIRRFSYLGAAAVTILTELVLFGQNVVLARRMFGFTPLPPNVLAISSSFVLILGMALWVGRRIPDIVVASAAAAAFGLCIYFSRTAHFSVLVKRAV
jgi:O-antigen/teichoic acid export membrane protein